MTFYSVSARMDMRQHSGGALLLNSLDFSPQSALSNETLFLLDPTGSPSPSMDFGGLNPSFSSQLVPDYSPSFLESASQNSFGLTMGSTTNCTPGQSQASSGFLIPADEWSGTTNSASGANSSQPQQGPQSSSPNQDQSFSSHGSLAQSVVVDPKKSSGWRYESYVPTASEVGQDACRAQLPISKSLDCGGELLGGQEHFQACVKQSSLQGSMLGSQLLQGHRQQEDFPTHFPSADFQEGFIGQGAYSEGAISDSLPDVSSQDASLQGDWSSAQALGVEGSEADNDQRLLESTHLAGSCSIQSNLLASVIQAKEGDNSVNYNRHVSNREALLQAVPGKNALDKPTTGIHLAQQADLGTQAMRDIALQLQGKLLRSPLQAQIPKHYINLLAAGIQSPNAYSQQSLLQAQGATDKFSSLQSHASWKDTSLSSLLQSQSHAQLQSLNQSQLQAHVQAQVAKQQAVVTQQAILQAQQMQGGSQQPLFHANQHGSFNSGQTKDVQSASHNLHLSGAQQIIAQMQPKLLNPVFQGLKAGGQHLLQRSPTGFPLAFGDLVEGNVRNPVPVAIASRCIQVLMSYIQEQRKRPFDNNILFWRNLVKDFFVPGATKRWCLASYNSSPMCRNAQGLFPMDYWFCNLCGVHPGRGFESSTDVLPRLLKIKYASGLVDELLFLDMAEEVYMLPSGRLVLEFPRAVHESIFPELRVVRYGKLRVTFSSSFKICSWEFCTKIHEEGVPRKNLLQQGQQLAKLVLDTEQEGFGKNTENLKSKCNEFTSTARQLAIKLEAPNVNDLGFSKRYVRCLQITEVVNSMKDLIAFERKTGLGPIASLNRFPTVRKMQSEGILTPSTISELINQITQGSRSIISSYSHARSSVQGQPSSHLQSGAPQGSDVAMAKVANQLPTLVRTQLEAHSDGFLNQQPVSQRQPPAVPAQPQSSNHLLCNSIGQSVVTQLGESYSQAQSQILSQASGHQTINFNQLAQQIYESAGSKQILQQPPNQLMPPSQPQSMIQVGQPCLPGTPQSEMTDIRSNT